MARKAQTEEEAQELAVARDKARAAMVAQAETNAEEAGARAQAARVEAAEKGEAVQAQVEKLRQYLEAVRSLYPQLNEKTGKLCQLVT